MPKRTRNILVVLLVVALCISGTVLIYRYATRYERHIKSSLGNIENKDIRELTPYEYYMNFEVFVLEPWIYGAGSVPTNYHLISLSSVNALMPTEYTVKIDNDTVAAVYRVYADDDSDALTLPEYPETYVFIFFDYNDKYEYWVKTGEMYFLSKCLSSADYADVCEGMTISEVGAKAPGAYYYYSKYNYHGILSEDEMQTCQKYLNSTVRPLTDGVMVIRYDVDPKRAEEPTVVGTQFFPYGSADMPEGITLKNFKPFECLKDVK